MSLHNLRDFVRALDDAGELVRVRESVSTVKEITEVADRCMKSPGGGPALLFERPLLPSGQVAQQPVAINLFGSRRRAGGISAACTSLARQRWRYRMRVCSQRSKN